MALFSRSELARFLIPLLFLSGGSAWAQSSLQMDVYKSPTCGCCGQWVEHMRQAGFIVKTHEVNDVPAARKRLGMPDRYGSCHVAKVGDYIIEGHVPATDVKHMLIEKPSAIGLAVPSMPLGSPGMESVHPVAYATLLITKNGVANVFAQH